MKHKKIQDKGSCIKRKIDTDHDRKYHAFIRKLERELTEYIENNGNRQSLQTIEDIFKYMNEVDRRAREIRGRVQSREEQQYWDSQRRRKSSQ